MCDSDRLVLNDTTKTLDNIKEDYETNDERLEIITSDRYDDIYDVIENHFIPDESLCRAFGVKWHEDFRKIIHGFLVQNMSVGLFARDTNELKGVKIIGVMKKSDPTDNVTIISYEPLREIFIFLTHQASGVNFFERYRCNKAAYFFAICVKRNHRRQGIASRLTSVAVAMCKELGFEALYIEGTSNYTHRISEKQNFEKLHKLPYRNYIYNGQPIINGTGEHTMTIIYGLKF
ncbi:uncharacterized protein LOC132715204 [Ruditapes philippinarum]|uniref:uncharacterized protein LOC132715204 n=1 Tax=Ruditapes philippinarum TaxID=129788 RepID=UPI00295B4630|nr:uncharacterized protein LOC132715204 [Ruditapes philippinarum]